MLASLGYIIRHDWSCETTDWWFTPSELTFGIKSLCSVSFFYWVNRHRDSERVRVAPMSCRPQVKKLSRYSKRVTSSSFVLMYFISLIILPFTSRGSFFYISRNSLWFDVIGFPLTKIFILSPISHARVPLPLMSRHLLSPWFHTAPCSPFLVSQDPAWRSSAHRTFTCRKTAFLTWRVCCRTCPSRLCICSGATATSSTPTRWVTE